MPQSHAMIERPYYIFGPIAILTFKASRAWPHRHIFSLVFGDAPPFFLKLLQRSKEAYTTVFIINITDRITLFSPPVQL